MIACPKCASTDVKTAQMVWESGAASTNSVSSGVGVGVVGGHLGVGVGGGRSRGSQISLLAQRHAPPRRANYTWAIVLGLIGALILAAILGNLVGAPLSFLVCIAAWAWVSFRMSKDYEAAWSERTRLWRRRWICQRCGTAGDESEFAAQAAAGGGQAPMAANGG